MKRLTEKQRRFVDEYLVDGNAVQAALRAGYAYTSARDNARDMLHQPHIRELLLQKQKQLEEELIVSRRQVVEEYARIAFFDIRNACDADGNLLPLDQMDTDTVRALGLEDTLEQRDAATPAQRRVRKLKPGDKKAALDALCRILGFAARPAQPARAPLRWEDNTGEPITPQTPAS